MSAPTPFPPHPERGYDADAVERFPWPVVAGYDDVHRWMDAGQAVHAAWQLRDLWEALIKFLASLAVADHLASAPADDPRTSRLLADLLADRGLGVGTWVTLMERTLKSGPPPGARLPGLAPLLYTRDKPSLLAKMFAGDETAFVRWRNECFGHGVFRKDEGYYVAKAKHWLGRLHDAYDLCRDFFHGLALEAVGPNGEILTWGAHTPLPFYHAHQPPAAGDFAPVRVRSAGRELLMVSPLLVVQPCEVCGQWWAFSFDKYERRDKKGRPRHRSWFLDFINGNTTERKNLEPLRQWTERVTDADWQAAAGRAPDPDERREPDPERFRDFQHEFEPPAYIARQVADFVTGRDRGVIWLTGPGGVGKSWATLGLDHAGMLPALLPRAVDVLHVSMHGPRQPTASEVWAALEERARRGKQWQVPPRPDGPTPHARFAAWLAALMRANVRGELIVALDGLDDLPAESDVPDLWPPANELPAGCYLVLSSRPSVRAAADAGLARVRSAASHFREVPIGPNEPEHRAILRRYVERRLAQRRADDQPPLPAAWAEPLIGRAEGSFLYVFHYCRALHFGVYAELSSLPPPSAFYPGFFDHLRGRVGDKLFEDCYARTLALIAAAREPVGMAHLTAWGLERGRLIAVLDDLADLLRTSREPWDAEALYSLGHDAIRQFLSEDVGWQRQLAEADRSLAELAVKRFAKDWEGADPFDSVERYLLFHLLDHAQEPKLRERLLGDTDLAAACLEHGNALWLMRGFKEALLAYDMACCLRQDQVERQGRREVRGSLATAYLNRGNALSDLGRLEEALAEYGACVELREALVMHEGYRNMRKDLAMAYMNQGILFRDLGRLGESLAKYRACIELYEALVQREGRRELRKDLASAYSNRGVTFGELGRLDEALQDHTACIELYKALVQREGCRELRDKLASGHMNCGITYWELKRLGEALEAYESCIELYEALVQGEGRSELRNEFARAYMNRGIALLDLGRLEEALEAYEACIELYEVLVQGEGRSELRSELAAARMNRGHAHAEHGRLEEALADYAACIELYETLVRREGRREFRTGFARAWMNRGNALWHLGRLDEALRDDTACIELYEVLVQREGRRALSKEYAGAYSNRGLVFGSLGQLEQALADHLACVELFEALVWREGHSELRDGLATAFMNRSIAYRNLGRLEEALADNAACIELYEALVLREGRRELMGDLAWGYATKARLISMMGEPEEARRLAANAVRLLRTEGAHYGRADLRKALEIAEGVLSDSGGQTQ
jgi:tetratricopeptide (TPR) repeat protein